MSAPLDQDMYAVAEARQPSVINTASVEKAAFAKEHDVTSSLPDEDGREPTEEELKTLRRVSGKIPWTAMTVTFVEFCEVSQYATAIGHRTLDY